LKIRISEQPACIDTKSTNNTGKHIKNTIPGSQVSVISDEAQYRHHIDVAEDAGKRIEHESYNSDEYHACAAGNENSRCCNEQCDSGNK